MSLHIFPRLRDCLRPSSKRELFEPDRRNVSATGVEAVMSAFLAHCEVHAKQEEDAISNTLDANSFDEISNSLIEIEHEEAGQDT